VPEFGTYFVVHVDFHDSQAKQYRADAVATVLAIAEPLAASSRLAG